MRCLTRRTFMKAAGLAASGALYNSALALNEPDFTLICPGDWQVMASVSDNGCSYNACMDWMAANRGASVGGLQLNTQAVIAVGDCADNGGNPAETSVVTNAYQRLNTASLPFITPPGNHDFVGLAAASRDAAISVNFTSGGVFAPDTRSAFYGSGLTVAGGGARAYWAGSYTATGASTAIRVVVGSRKLLIIALDFYPTLGMLAWANGLHDTWTDHEVIITTHGYLTDTGALCQRGAYAVGTPTEYGPVQFAMGSVPNSTSAQEMLSGVSTWGGFVSMPRLRMVVCGHWRGQVSHAGSGSWYWQRTPATRTDGGLIQQLYCNGQDVDNTFCSVGSPGIMGNGRGMMMILKFRNSLGLLEGYMYSVGTQKWIGQPNDSFLYAPATSTTPVQLFSVAMPALTSRGLFPMPSPRR
jgi:hypothetical protein